MIKYWTILSLSGVAATAYWYPDMLLFVMLGFLAQLIDGSLGMAYGVFLSTGLMVFGLPLVHVSSSIHFSEIFTTFASAISHWKFKNINVIILKKLAIPGVVGGVMGTYVLTNINGNMIKPFVSVYLILLGVKILFQVGKKIKIKRTKYLGFLGLVGGFCDAIGGGGWGPIVNGSLLSRGYTAKKSIGTVNTVEFFVTLAQSVIFLVLVENINFKLVSGLILGGVLAAPLGAYLCSRINVRFLVGILIIVVNIYGLYIYGVDK